MKNLIKGFFKNKKLLVVEGEIDPEIKKIKIDENASADITIYIMQHHLQTHDKYLILIYILYLLDKEVEDINVEVSPYPDREYINNMKIVNPKPRKP